MSFNSAMFILKAVSIYVGISFLLWAILKTLKD